MSAIDDANRYGLYAQALQDQLDSSSGGGGYGQSGSDVAAALTASSGFERLKLQAQIDNAKQAQANALKIAKLQSSTSLGVANIGAAASKYGVDVGRQNLLDQLKENQRQFDANHDLDMQKFGLSKDQFQETKRQFGLTFGEGQRQFDLTYGLQNRQLGLDYAKAYTQFAQTPDMVWALNDFKGATGRAAAGLGQAPLDASNAPNPKSQSDFAALANYGQDTGTWGGLQLSSDAAGAPSGGGSADTGTGGSSDQVGATADDRMKAIRAVSQAIPPSEGTGHDSQDWAALNAIKSLYFARRPGSVEALGQARRKTAQAGLARLGYSAPQVEEDYSRSLPWQGSSRSA
jgi:hypothetical protein